MAGAERGAVELFRECYRSEPDGVWRAPGRVNFIGEHTDYNGGFALPFAISAGVFVAAAARQDGILALSSRQHPGGPVTAPVAGLEPGRVAGWAAYPAGVVWALAAAGHRPGGASLAIDADLPAGAGLSSSAALECATALALSDLYRLALPRAQLAAIGRRAENDFVGAPTGIMDQLAVLLGQAGQALLLDCRAGTATGVPFDPAAAAADGLADPELRRRARHVISENARVLQTAELLRAGASEAGPLLTSSHQSLRDDFEVSWPEADAAVQAAVEAGAAGARMTGGGFGGSVIALVPAGVADGVAAAVTARFAHLRWRAPSITQTEPSPGARRLR